MFSMKAIVVSTMLAGLVLLPAFAQGYRPTEPIGATRKSQTVFMIDPECEPPTPQRNRPHVPIQPSKPKLLAGRLNGTFCVDFDGSLLRAAILGQSYVKLEPDVWANKQEESAWKKWRLDLANAIFDRWRAEHSIQEQASVKVFLDPSGRIATIQSDSPVAGKALEDCIKTTRIPPLPHSSNPVKYVSFDVTAAVDPERFPRQNAYDYGCVAVVSRKRRTLNFLSNGGDMLVKGLSRYSVACNNGVDDATLKLAIEALDDGHMIMLPASGFAAHH
jgi:hypothetical protein